MKQTIDISVIVLNFNTKELTLSCVRSVQACKTPEDHWEILVVDNASTDGSAEEFNKELRGVTILPLDKNIGYAAGNNYGIKRANGRYILLLNSDTEISRDAITTSLVFMDQHPEVGVATCTVLLPNGMLDPACHRGFPSPWAAFTYFIGLEKIFPSSPIFGRYHLGYKDMSKPHEIDSPAGAFYFVRRDVIDTVGLLDEEYFMYGEDLDWSYRIKKAGWKIYYLPFAAILHRKKQSGRNNEDTQLRKKTNKYFYDTMALFYRKHYKDRYSPIVYGLVLLGITIRSRL